MYMQRFLLILAVGYATMIGYSILIPDTLALLELNNEYVRNVIIVVAGASYAVSVQSLVFRMCAKQYERALLVFAVVCGYVAFVSAVTAMQMKPMYSDFQWWFLVAFFSVPFILSAAFLAQAKYEDRPAAVAA
jgi:hypothetical protein